MLAFSPYTFTTSGWQPAQDVMATAGDLHHEEPFVCSTSKETDTSYQSIIFSPTPPELDADDLLAGDKDHHSSSSTRKSSHNAYERHRRKQLNVLYSSLRELIPGSDQTKKLSIPVIISRVVKYIPELQREVKKLACRKEELMLASTRHAQQRNPCSDHVGATSCFPAVSATCVSDREVMVQVMLKKNVGMSLGQVLGVLEGEGLQLMSASSCATHGDSDRSICSLQLQAREDIGFQNQFFCDHLIQAIKKDFMLDNKLDR